MLNEHLFYAKVVKLKALSEQKKRWLDEFQKTLGWIEFNQKLAGMKAEEKQKIHKEFIEKMMIDKEYSREIYLAQKLLEVCVMILTKSSMKNGWATGTRTCSSRNRSYRRSRPSLRTSSSTCINAARSNYPSCYFVLSFSSALYTLCTHSTAHEPRCPKIVHE